MTSPRQVAVRFAPSHPFWDEAVAMRQSNHTLAEVVEAAADGGHSELTYSVVKFGLRAAPADFHLPLHASRFLRRRYQKATADFDALEEMRDLIRDAMREISDIDDDLAEPDMRDGRRITLELRRDALTSRAFAWVATYAATDSKYHSGDADEGRGSPQLPADAAAVRAIVERLAQEFREAAPVPPLARIGETFGHDHIRLPGDKREELPSVDPEADV